jgi:hypothetical protein
LLVTGGGGGLVVGGIVTVQGQSCLRVSDVIVERVRAQGLLGVRTGDGQSSWLEGLIGDTLVNHLGWFLMNLLDLV